MFSVGPDPSMTLYMPFRESKSKYKGRHKYLLLADGVPLKSPPHPKFGSKEAAELYGRLLETAPAQAAFLRDAAQTFDGVIV